MVQDRILCDSYSKSGKHIFGDDPNTEFNKQILRINEAYGWLYDKGILERVSFVFKDYKDTTYFALDTNALAPYRKQLEESGLPDASLSANLIFDRYIQPCTYSGAIQLGWTMFSYRDVDGVVGRSWECDLIKALNTDGIYKVAEVMDKDGVKAAVQNLFSLFDWEPTLHEKKAASLSGKISDAEKRTAAQNTAKTEPTNDR